MFRYALAALLLAGHVAAQDLSQFEKILLPGWTSQGVTGADGRTFAGGAIVVSLAPAKYWPAYDNGVGTLTPRTVMQFPGVSRAGRILHVERAYANQISADVTLFIEHADGTPRGITTIPIVRERDFLSGTSRIINIGSLYTYEPVLGSLNRAIPQFRHHLRIYDIDGSGTAQVLVRRFDQGFNPNPLTQQLVTLNSRDGSDASYPAYAELVLEEICHPFSPHTPCAGGEQIVEIEPVAPGLRYWAMVTGTDNHTGQVHVKWPQ